MRADKSGAIPSGPRPGDPAWDMSVKSQLPLITMVYTGIGTTGRRLVTELSELSGSDAQDGPHPPREAGMDTIQQQDRRR